jgi:hypothetical protein
LDQPTPLAPPAPLAPNEALPYRANPPAAAPYAQPAPYRTNPPAAQPYAQQVPNGRAEPYRGYAPPAYGRAAPYRAYPPAAPYRAYPPPAYRAYPPLPPSYRAYAPPPYPVYPAYPAYPVYRPYPPPSPVAPHELNGFIGNTLHGRAYANLGIVSAADRTSGTIAVVGRHGELATVHTSMLVRNGKSDLRAPLLTSADIARRSNSGMSRVPLMQGQVIIEESNPPPPPFGPAPNWQDCTTERGLLYRSPSSLCR